MSLLADALEKLKGVTGVACDVPTFEFVEFVNTDGLTYRAYVVLARIGDGHEGQTTEEILADEVVALQKRNGQLETTLRAMIGQDDIEPWLREDS